ncbi:TetR/AcrR family transcriptional regulator C-terminal domain-containing protein [Pseudonocardia lacus]|uniref:TetR/AcrR family transcriptional regulator C-terminal domain-containing protein n=1 Tax=Pseudonocardia lacus TaxID=2835865 RepID=UPI0027E292A7|nr:TetR/AcrR family transcriptional regulator C-terminal domain-containing protein [Pseudonocardia lacus]
MDQERGAQLGALLWQPETRGSRGPRRSLTVSAVVEQAIEIADRDGLVALSMSRLARSLGLGTMSLYGYVATKDDLVALMVDAAYGEPPGPTSRPWRAGITEWAEALREVYLAHRWLVPMMSSVRTLGPREAAWAESLLRIVRPLALSSVEALSVLGAVVALVQGTVRLSATEAASEVGTAWARGTPLVGIGVLDAHDHAREMPLLRDAIAEVWPLPVGQRDMLVFGLTRLLDGLAVEQERRAAQHPPNGG